MEIKSRKRFLVIGDDTRSFLSVVRSLGSKDNIVDVVCFDRQSIACNSKYISNFYFYNFQSHTKKQWIKNVINVISQNAYDAVIPCDERSIFPIYENRFELEKYSLLALPNDKVIDCLFDKVKTKELAKNLEINHAKGFLINLKDRSYQEISNILGCRFVIKPIYSYLSDNLSIRQKVSVINNAQEFKSWQENNLNGQNYLVEEYFNGIGEGISLLSINGKVLTAFAHTRVSEPNSGGGSSYRKSIKIDSSMYEACKMICSETDYTGVGMFEFKKDISSGKWILIEVNARFWGSLPLAIFSGIDFPLMYIEELARLNAKNNSTLASEESQINYHIGRYSRSLLSDIYDIKSEFDSNRVQLTLSIALFKLITRLFSYARILTFKEKIDTFCLYDLKPFKSEVGVILRGFNLYKFFFTLCTKNKSSNVSSFESLIKSGNFRSIKFICYGNIIRSPFACAYLKKLITGINNKYEVDSYGLHQIENRKVAEFCSEVASGYYVNLNAHRSKWLRQEHVNNSDLIFYFDEKNFNKLNCHYNLKHAFNLADFLPQKNINEIADPYGKGEDALHYSYKLISLAVDNIFEIIKKY